MTLSIRKVAEQLGVSVTVVRTAIKERRLRAMRLTANGAYRITQEAIAEWLRNSELQPKQRKKISKDGLEEAGRHGLL